MGLKQGPGSGRASSQSRLRQHGFTLLELLVVLAIMTLALGAAALALRDPAQVALAQEGQRLAAWLETGRAAARASGQTVRWRATATGFELAGGSQPSPPQRWLDARTTVVAFSVAGAAPVPAPVGAWLLVLGPEPVLPAQSLLLGLEGHSLRVTSDGLSPFAVQPAP